MTLPRKIMEQGGLCPTKLWINADFAPQNHRAFVLCPTKCWRLFSLPRKTMKQCRLCPEKSLRHSFRGLKFFLVCFLFFLCVVNQCNFRGLFNPLEHFIGKLFCVTVHLRPLISSWCWWWQGPWPGYQKALERGNSVPRPKGFCEADKVKLSAVMSQNPKCRDLRLIDILIFFQI